MGHRVVLLISGDDCVASQLNELLNGHCSIVSTNSGLEAVYIARDLHPDVIILFRNLPDTQGLFVLSALKRHYPAIPVIFISNSPDPPFKLAVLKYGVEKYFLAPVNLEQLQTELIKICDKPPYSYLGNIKHFILSKFQKQPAVTVDNVILPYNPIMRLQGGGEITQSMEREKISTKSLLDQSIAQQHSMGETGATSKLSKPGDNCLKVYFLGNFCLEIKGRKHTDWPSKKGKEILAYLLYHHKKMVFRDVLMETFWPGSPPFSARNSLHVVIHEIRQWLQTIDKKIEYILFKDECYFLNTDIEIWIDVDDFSKYWQQGNSIERTHSPEAALPYYEKAAAIYRGDFIEEELYKNWLSLERDHLKEIYLTILDKLSYFYSNDGKPLTAITLGERILRKDNCRENIHRRLMNCYYRMGQRDKAIKQFQKCCQNLQSELDVEPSSQTVELYQKIKKGEN